MNFHPAEPLLYIIPSILINNCTSGIGVLKGAVVGGTMFAVDRLINVEHLVKNSLGQFMTSKGIERERVEQVCSLAHKIFKLMLSAVLLRGLGVINQPFIEILKGLAFTSLCLAALDYCTDAYIKLKTGELLKKKETLNKKLNNLIDRIPSKPAETQPYREERLKRNNPPKTYINTKGEIVKG